MTRPSCTVTALLYSGRPDPRWEISEGQLTNVKHVWATLRLTKDRPPRAKLLGYRGCLVQCTRAQEWFAYCGVVMLTRGTHRPSYRLDPSGHFERTVLATAPPGLLPASLSLPAAPTHKSTS